MSSKKDKSSAETGIAQSGKGVEQATAMTPEEQSQYSKSFETGQLLDQIFRYLSGAGSAPSGYQNPEEVYQKQGPLAQGLYGTALQDINSPYGAYESSLKDALALANDSINRQAQGRGLLQSGIPIEQMGRAGAELAIQEAQGRMSARQQAISNAYNLGGTIQNQSSQNLANLASLYGSQQSLGQQSMGRQASGATNAAQYYAYPYQAQLGSYYGGQAALQALPGQLIAAGSKVAAASAGGA